MHIIRYFFFLCFIGCSFVLGSLFFVAHNKGVDFSVLERYNSGRPSIVLDDEGNEWARFELDRREPIAYKDLPKYLVDAFVAREDWSFFQHGGVSFKGMLRSFLVNIYHGRKMQGASTITQQLVRLLFFEAKKNVCKKN